ncbi:MAG: 2-hydroxyacid dehydrogenase [Betaproteobacteria bacterium]|nr:2-hydroxyacid dehydrogenase [Betaproteobacteria bacterium]
MHKPRILQKGRLLPALEKVLNDEFAAHRLADEPDADAFLAAHGHEFTALVTSARFGADAAMMAAMPSLKAICSFGVGYETIDVDEAKHRGIAVSNTPGVLDDCVADIAFGLLIDVARGISASDRFVRRGEWLKGAFPLQTRVSGKRLGILGLGRIGRVIAKRAGGFDIEVRYHNRRPVATVDYGYEPTLIGLARWADFLVVASAGGGDTRHLVSSEVLAALGPNGYLINIARGSVVDEAALVDALVNKRIAGAGLDVFEAEPNVPAALIALDNVVLLPHVASGTRETRQAMADLTLANLRHFISTGALLTAVT